MWQENADDGRGYYSGMDAIMPLKEKVCISEWGAMDE